MRPHDAPVRDSSPREQPGRQRTAQFELKTEQAACAVRASPLAGDWDRFCSDIAAEPTLERFPIAVSHRSA